MTAGEAANVEKKESNLNQEERDMRKLDNGHLTSSDKRHTKPAAKSALPQDLPGQPQCDGAEYQSEK